MWSDVKPPDDGDDGSTRNTAGLLVNRARLVISTAVVLTTVVPALALGGAPAPAAASAATSCQGKPVTIVATTEVTTGTEGDDVVAMTPGAWETFDALGRR